MKRPYFLISGAWLIHAISWFLPAVQESLFSSRVPGWAAFLFSAASLVPDSGKSFDVSFRTLLLAGSVLSTVLFVLASPWIVWRGSRRVLFASAWAAAAAFLVNVQWFVVSLSEKPGVGIGYFLWWCSFALLAIGLFDLARQTEHVSSAPQQRLSNI
jgi:hypothetical protein